MFSNKKEVILTLTLASVLHHYHERLEQLLLCQQEALIQLDFALATDLLIHYQALLSAHIELENSLLLPLHETLEKPRWATSLYRHEHTKILDLVSRAQNKLDIAQQDKANSQRRIAINLLDYQCTLKGVLEHHEQREEKGLVVELSAHLAPNKEQILAEQCEAQWQRDFAEKAAALTPLLARLGLTL